MAGHGGGAGAVGLPEPGSEKGKVLDMDIALDRLDGDRELYDEICQYFLDTVPEQLSRMDAAFEKDHAGTLRREAHSLKSSSGSVGAMRLNESSRKVEMIASGDEKGSLGSALDELRQDLSDAIDALQAVVK